MSIRPILSALLRNKTAPLLIALQVALTLAIVTINGWNRFAVGFRAEPARDGKVAA